MLSGSTLHRQEGFSLISLMVAIFISVILLAGILNVMVRVTESGAASVRTTRLNQELRSTLDTVSRDLQRAGYVDWYDAWDTDNDSVPATRSALADVNGDSEINVLDFYQAVAPALDRMGEVSLWSFPTPGTSTGTPTPCSTNCDCILFSYDLNKDGAQGIGTGTAGTNQNTANFELFGYRWNAGVLQTRTAGNTHACNAGTWEDMTSENVNITGMTFGVTYATSVGAGNDSTAYQFDDEGNWNSAFQTSCTPVDNDNTSLIPADSDVLCLLRRKVDIGVTASLANDADVTVTLNTDVKIKNDFFNSQP